jgi:hypothetical protein
VNEHTLNADAPPPQPGTVEWAQQRQRTYELAMAKGNSAEHTAARRTVIMDFISVHNPKTAENPQPFLVTVDFASPVRVVNGRDIDMDHPKATGFFGMGRKPAYLRSENMPPKTPEDPVYALEYFAKT